MAHSASLGFLSPVLQALWLLQLDVACPVDPGEARGGGTLRGRAWQKVFRSLGHVLIRD